MPHSSRIEGAAPFLKWAGGKSRLLKQYTPYFPRVTAIRNYFEPFIGSAAVFFHLQPRYAKLSDINPKLVKVYLVVQNNVESLIASLQRHKNNEEYYYHIRALNPADLNEVEQAARLIFLNKTCYNGLYRENRQGHFNVPFGRYKNPKICDEERLRAASAALQGVDLQEKDFDQAVSQAGPGDFVYFDPPYVPISPTSNFTSYNRHDFRGAEQKRLAETIHQLSRRNCKVMLSNSNAALVHELYSTSGYHLVNIRARRNINSKANRRGPITELLVLNYDPEH